MPLDLADDGRRRVRGELHPALGIEAVNGLDKPDRRDLGQVVERLATVAEAAGQVLHQRQVHPDELVTDLRPFGSAVGHRDQLGEQFAGTCPVVGFVRVA